MNLKILQFNLYAQELQAYKVVEQKHAGPEAKLKHNWKSYADQTVQKYEVTFQQAAKWK